MLQTLMTSYPDLQLLVPGILGKLLREHVTLEESSAISSESHLLCWGYDDGLVQDGKEGTGEGEVQCFRGGVEEVGGSGASGGGGGGEVQCFRGEVGGSGASGEREVQCFRGGVGEVGGSGASGEGREWCFRGGGGRFSASGEGWGRWEGVESTNVSWENSTRFKFVLCLLRFSLHSI